MAEQQKAHESAVQGLKEDVNRAERRREATEEELHAARMEISSNFPDLDEEVKQAALHYQQSSDPEEDVLKVFFTDFLMADRVITLPDRVRQVAGLMRIAKTTMLETIATLWKEKDIPTNSFALSDRIEQAPVQVQWWQQSAAREGAQMVLVLLRVHYKKVDLHAIEWPAAVGKDGKQVQPQNFFDEVRDHALGVEKYCSLKEMIE